MNSALGPIALTIFTPTYNRAHLLPRLYSSIAPQVAASDGVEWLVIDDGSTDDTHEVISGFENARPDFVRSMRVANGGKHRAINRGLVEARGRMFFIVDSDDYLPDGAIRKILEWSDRVARDERSSGICGMMSLPDGSIVGGARFPDSPTASDFIDMRQRLGIAGDVALVVKTDIFREFKFPEIEGETFIAEGIVWHRLAESFRFMCFNEVVYVADYQSDGLSALSLRNRMKNPIGATLLYSELFKNARASEATKLKALINYWRFFFCRSAPFHIGLGETGAIASSICAVPFSFLLHLLDSRKVAQ